MTERIVANDKRSALGDAVARSQKQCFRVENRLARDLNLVEGLTSQRTIAASSTHLERERGAHRPHEFRAEAAELWGVGAMIQ